MPVLIARHCFFIDSTESVFLVSRSGAFAGFGFQANKAIQYGDEYICNRV